MFLKCRRVDAEGPLVQLKNLLFSEQTLMTIVEWVTVSGPAARRLGMVSEGTVEDVGRWRGW